MKYLQQLIFQGVRSFPFWGTRHFKRHLGSANTITAYSAGKKDSYFHSANTTNLLGVTFGQLIDRIPDRFGDQLAVIDCANEIRKTHIEMKEDIDKLATGLLALNLQRGDRIALWSPNRYEWVLSQMAAAKAGLVLVTINPAYQPNEFAYCLDKVGIRAVICPESFVTQNYYEMILKVVPQVADSKPGQVKSKTYPNFDTVITLGDKDLPGTFKLKDVMNAGGSREKERLEKLQSEIQFDDVVNFQFTSGTTGKPKAAPCTHFVMLNNCVFVAQCLGYFDEFAKICCPVPLFHAFGCVGASTITIVSGSCAVFPSPGYSAENVLKSIEREKCTSIYGTPTMFVDFLNHPNFSRTDFSSLRVGTIGASPCSPQLVKQIMDKMHCPGLIVGYGTTETGAVISLNHHSKDDESKKLSYVGRLAHHTEAKIVDQNDRIVSMGTIGEICIRGFNIMNGFWEDDEKTREVIKDGWYHTGDLGTLNEDGYLTVMGRTKDMIIRGGENIYSKEIEDYLNTHPNISDVHVIGVPDKRMGEEICAWIKIKPDAKITEVEVKQFCAGQISHFKIPRYIRFVNDFPKTATGKVQKFLMREEMIKSFENN